MATKLKSQTYYKHIKVLMTGLIDEVGQYRHGGVGVMSGDLCGAYGAACESD